MGVRPEHARPWADGAGLIGPLDGTVEYAEALGRETFLGVRHPAGARLVRVRRRPFASPAGRSAWPTGSCPTACASSTRTPARARDAPR